MDIQEIPTNKLKADYKGTLQDIIVCEEALSRGITTYGEGRSTTYRLETNKKIAKKIEAELQRRNAASSTPEGDLDQDDDTTSDVQADEQVAEPNQLSCTCEYRGLSKYRGLTGCAGCGKPLAG